MGKPNTVGAAGATNLYTNSSEGTFTKEAFYAAKEIVKGLRKVYPNLRKTYTRSQIQHLVLGVLESLGTFEAVLGDTPEEAIRTCATATYGTAPDTH